MNCYFCDNPIKDNQLYCETQSCRSHYVTYVWFTMTYKNGAVDYDLYKVQFKCTFKTKDDYKDILVNYYPLSKNTEIIEQITPPFDPEDESVSINFTFKEIVKLKDIGIVVTPHNFQEKLPLLITFS